MAFLQELPLLQSEVRCALCPVEEAVEVPCSALGEADQQKLAALSAPALRAQFHASRAALRQALPPGTLGQTHFEARKPVHPLGHLSLSHSRSMGAAAFSRTLQLGIDFEERRDEVVRLRARFVRPDETHLLDERAPHDGLQTIWGIKESLYKLQSRPGTHFLNHLKIEPLRSMGPWQVGMAWITYETPEAEEGVGVGVATRTEAERESDAAASSNGHAKAAFVMARCEPNGPTLCLATHRPPLEPMHSQRLVLREWTQKDASFLFELNQDPEVLKYTGDVPFASEADALAFIRSYSNYQVDGFGRWLVARSNTGEPLGWCGLKKHPWGIDLGFRLKRACGGQGIATEAAERAITFARAQGWTVLHARVDAANAASKRVLEKVGFIRNENVQLRQQMTDLKHSHSEDIHLYSLAL